ncbi:MAG TPA: cation:proton antiporter subunit C [Atribacteraceae bacterium]|nr:cation:proton antiporter subunit C [Atribacteraceae bacterium]
MIYAMCFLFFLVGLYGVLVKRNLIKIILGSGIMGYALNLYLVLIGYREGGGFPIHLPDETPKAMVDPLTQALVLTSIVIELATTALLVSLAIKIYQHYQTLDIHAVRRLKG